MGVYPSVEELREYIKNTEIRDDYVPDAILLLQEAMDNNGKQPLHLTKDGQTSLQYKRLLDLNAGNIVDATVARALIINGKISFEKFDLAKDINDEYIIDKSFYADHILLKVASLLKNKIRFTEDVIVETQRPLESNMMEDMSMIEILDSTNIIARHFSSRIDEFIEYKIQNLKNSKEILLEELEDPEHTEVIALEKEIAEYENSETNRAKAIREYESFLERDNSNYQDVNKSTISKIFSDIKELYFQNYINLDRNGRIDFLKNVLMGDPSNPDVERAEEFDELDMEDQDYMLNEYLEAVTNIVKYYPILAGKTAPILKTSEGLLINLTSDESKTIQEGREDDINDDIVDKEEDERDG